MEVLNDLICENRSVSQFERFKYRHLFRVVCFEQDGAFYIVAKLITEYTTVNYQISVSQTLRGIV